jgi:hypothetical protein
VNLQENRKPTSVNESPCVSSIMFVICFVFAAYCLFVFSYICFDVVYLCWPMLIPYDINAYFMQCNYDVLSFFTYFVLFIVVYRCRAMLNVNRV